MVKLKTGNYARRTAFLIDLHRQYYATLVSMIGANLFKNPTIMHKLVRNQTKAML